MVRAPAPDTDTDVTPISDALPDPDLVDACGTNPGGLCEWVYNATDGNAFLAGAARWFVDHPLTIILILSVAWIVSRIAHRGVDRVVDRVVGRGPLGQRSLERLGLSGAATFLDDAQDQARAARADARSRSISAVLGSFVTVVIWTVAVFIIVGEMGIQLAPLIASAGIAGIALGFGAQSLVKDCITGLFILMEDQYGIGDVVDVGEATGVVEEIALRTTVLRSLDGTVWHVPNGEITRVGNLSQLWSVALVDIDVAYDADLDLVERVMLDTAESVCAEEDWVDDIVEEPTLLGVERLGADGITIRLVVKCAPGTQWALQRQLRQRMKVALDQAGIEIPFPQRTVWIRREDGAADEPGQPS